MGSSPELTFNQFTTLQQGATEIELPPNTVFIIINNEYDEEFSFCCGYNDTSTTQTYNAQSGHKYATAVSTARPYISFYNNSTRLFKFMPTKQSQILYPQYDYVFYKSNFIISQ